MLIPCTVVYLLLSTTLGTEYSLDKLKLKHNISYIGTPGAIRYHEANGITRDFSSRVTVKFFRIEDELYYSDYFNKTHVKDLGKCVAYGIVYQGFYYYSYIKEKRS